MKCLALPTKDPPLQEKWNKLEEYSQHLPTSKENPGELFTISSGRNKASDDPDWALPAISMINRLFSWNFVNVKQKTFVTQTKWRYRAFSEGIYLVKTLTERFIYVVRYQQWKNTISQFTSAVATLSRELERNTLQSFTLIYFKVQNDANLCFCTVEEGQPFLTVFHGANQFWFSLQWWPVRNRYLEDPNYI